MLASAAVASEAARVADAALGEEAAAAAADAAAVAVVAAAAVVAAGVVAAAAGVRESRKGMRVLNTTAMAKYNHEFETTCGTVVVTNSLEAQRTGEAFARCIFRQVL